MKNPTAAIRLSTGGTIRLELYPEIAPHAVTSFLYLAQRRVFDGFPIERIVPGWVVDVTYHAFQKPEACYFIPNDAKSGRYLDAVFGTVGLGGYGAPDIAGGEFFFPLADCPAITGKYPIFGKVVGGLDELRRLEQAETVPRLSGDAGREDQHTRRPGVSRGSDRRDLRRRVRRAGASARGGKAALLAGNLAVRENSIQITVSGEANHINRMTEKTGISEISQNSVE